MSVVLPDPLADQRVNRACGHGRLDPVQRAQAAEVLRQSVDGQERAVDLGGDARPPARVPVGRGLGGDGGRAGERGGVALPAEAPADVPEEAQQAARDEQHHEETDNEHDLVLVVAEGFAESVACGLRAELEEEGAEDRSDEAADAADEGGEDLADRLEGTHRVGRDVGDVGAGGLDGAHQRHDGRREGEGTDLHAVGVDRSGSGGDLGVPDRVHGAAPTAEPEVPRERDRNAEADGREVVLAQELVVASQRPELGRIDRAGRGGPLEKAGEHAGDRQEQAAEGEGDDREVEAAEVAAEQGETDPHQPADQECEGQRPDTSQSELLGPDPAREEPDQHERRVAEGQQSGLADQDVGGKRSRCERHGLGAGQDPGPVVGHGERDGQLADDDDGDDQRGESDRRPPCRCTQGGPGAPRTHTFSTCGSPNSPVGRRASTANTANSSQAAGFSMKPMSGPHTARSDRTSPIT